MKSRPPSTRARSPSARPRDADATRKAILASARQAFAQHGYDGVGVREIAAGAGVTAMLINRYFGSKEKLFTEVAGAAMGHPVILTPAFLEAGCPHDAFARALVALTGAGSAPLEGFLLLLRSAASPRAAAIGREQVQTHYQTPLARALRGAHGAERAGLVLSLVVGFQMMRQAVGLPVLTEAEPAVLEALLGRALGALLEPEDA